MIDNEFKYLGIMETSSDKLHGKRYGSSVMIYECLHCCAIVTNKEHHMFWHRNNRLVVEGD